MRRGTDTQARVTIIHFALAMPHAKCNDSLFNSSLSDDDDDDDDDDDIVCFSQIS